MISEPGGDVNDEEFMRGPAHAAHRSIHPIETALATGCFLLLCGNVWADWQSESYGGGVVSVALIGAILAILGKNAGSLIGGGKQ